jgi:hypothetical protein
MAEARSSKLFVTWEMGSQFSQIPRKFTKMVGLLVLVGFITHYVHTLPQGLQELLLFAQQINQHGIDITDWHNVWKERIFSPCRLSYHIRLGY